MTKVVFHTDGQDDRTYPHHDLVVTDTEVRLFKDGQPIELPAGPWSVAQYPDDFEQVGDEPSQPTPEPPYV